MFKNILQTKIIDSPIYGGTFRTCNYFFMIPKNIFSSIQDIKVISWAWQESNVFCKNDIILYKQPIILWEPPISCHKNVISEKWLIISINRHIPRENGIYRRENDILSYESLQIVRIQHTISSKRYYYIVKMPKYHICST